MMPFVLRGRRVRMAPVAHAVLTLLAIIGVVGCATDQQTDVDAYRAISRPPGPPPTHAPGAPLALDAAMRLTAAYNEQLAIQGERYVQALAERQRLAAFLRPTFEFFTDVGIDENTARRRSVETDVGVTGQYRLLTGLSDLRNVRAAEARAEAVRWLILDLREALLVQVARAYYDALRAERLTTVLESSLDAQSQRLEDARARQTVGFVRPLDVAQIEAQVSRTRAQLISARRAEGEARSVLALLTNADVSASPLIDGFSPPDDARSPAALLAIAHERRQDILAARADADASRAVVDAAIGEYFPSIALNLDYFLTRTDGALPDITSLIAVRVPLFTAGRIEASVRSAWSAFRERVLIYRLREREVRRDVEIAALRLDESRDLVAELRVQLRVAREALELAEAAYQAGLGTNLERVVAQDQLLSAELDTVVAEFAVKTAHLELLRACGVLAYDALAAPLPTPTERPVPESPFLDPPAAPETPA